MFRKFICALALATIALASSAQSRVIRTINDGWIFTQEGKSTAVNIPHTWNADDTWDDEPGFYRGECTYERTITINDDLEGRNVYVRFEGANQVTELIVNGVSLGRHIGGYTAFCFDATPAIKKGDNAFCIKVDNSFNENIPPLTADYTFYGGIYRDIDLVFTPADHISTTHHASSGVYITTPSVSEAQSTMEVSTHLTLATPAKYILSQEVYDPSGKVVAGIDTKLKIKAADADYVCRQALTVTDCKLWDIDDPEVYRVVTTLKDAKGLVLDRVENPAGFRNFSFDVEKGFTMNGRHVKLMGTNRHQDYCELGNALSDEMHSRDIALLKDMGGNFLRIAHYPQDPIVTQCCDREGIVNSIEIPVINYITMTDEFKKNCVDMAVEMVCQNYNNPSVIIWAYMNECLLRLPKFTSDKAKLAEYYAYITSIAQAVDDAIKALDPYRYTMLPCHSGADRYKDSGIGEVADIIGWNFYSGWYSGRFDGFHSNVMKYHGMFPDKPVIITEYGAGVDPRLHSRKPARFDFSEEYGLMFHKYYIDEIRANDFIAGSNVWNLNDFYSEGRVDAVPHVNNKGLVGLDRVQKDSYRLYQANLLDEPFLMIGGRTWTLRGGNEGETCTVEVYTNAAEVSLTHNGVSLGTARAEKGVASFSYVPSNGENILAAEAAGGLKDLVRFNYSAIPADMTAFREMNVMLGSDRYFQDEIAGAAWIPEQEYRPGSWGYVGGSPFYPKTGRGVIPCSSLDIIGTANDPIFQTQRTDIKAFKADVPDGTYYVYLYFAELAVNDAGEPLPYNLGADVVGIPETERVFNVSINGTRVLTDYDIRSEHGARTAAIRKFTVDVRDGQGLTIAFDPVKGHPVLNALRLYRCF